MNLIRFFAWLFVGAVFPSQVLSARDIETPIIIPSVQFAQTPIQDAVDFLVARSRELDSVETDPSKKGLNVILLGDFEGVHLTLRLADVPILEILRVTAELVDAELEIGDEVVAISRQKPYEVVTRREGSEKVEAKLRRITIPSIELQDTPLKDAIDFLQQRSAELDSGKGINLALKQLEPAPISLNLKNVTLYTALETVAKTAGYTMEIREHLVFFKASPKP